MSVDDKIAPGSNGKQSEPEGDPSQSVSTEELKNISNGIFRWSIVEIILIVVLIAVMFLAGSEAGKHATSEIGPETSLSLGWLTVELVAVYGIIRVSRRVERKTDLRRAIFDLHKQANELKPSDSPDGFVGNLSSVRFFLIKWIRSRGQTPQRDYYVRRVRREIEVLFSVVPEMLYLAWFETEKDGQSHVPVGTLTYRRINRWIVDIGLHLTAKRRIFTQSWVEYWTILYVLREKNEELRRLNKDLVGSYEKAADEFLDRLERQIETRKSVLYAVIRDLGIAALPVILTAFLIGFV